MTVTNNLHPTTFPPQPRVRTAPPEPTPTAKPEAQPDEPATPVSPGGMVGNNINTTA
jgi:hypothetical protein